MAAGSQAGWSGSAGDQAAGQRRRARPSGCRTVRHQCRRRTTGPSTLAWKPIVAGGPLEGPLADGSSNEGELSPRDTCAEVVVKKRAQLDGQQPSGEISEQTNLTEETSEAAAGQSGVAKELVVEPVPDANPPAGDEAKIQFGVAAVITQMTAMATSQQESLTPFHCKFPPNVSIRDYLARICRYSNCSAGCLVTSLLYIDRLIKRRPLVVVSPLSCHRLMLTAVVLAVKFHDDTYYSNAFYAKVGGVQLKEFNSLERKFLQLIDWKLHVDDEEYNLYRSIICKAACGGQ